MDEQLKAACDRLIAGEIEAIRVGIMGLADAMMYLSDNKPAGAPGYAYKQEPDGKFVIWPK